MRIKILKYKISEVEDIDDYDGWSVELETIYFQLEIDDVIENVVVKKITEVIDGKFEKYFVNHQNEFSVKTESDSVSERLEDGAKETFIDLQLHETPLHWMSSYSLGTIVFIL